MRYWAGTAGPEEARAAVSDGRCPSRLFLLWPLAAAEPGLFQRLMEDPLIETYSIYGLFPGVYEWVYLGDEPPEVTWEGRTRGHVGIFRRGDEGLVVKPLQNQREDEIAAIAGRLGAGPKQLASVTGFLVEEFCRGRFFTELPEEILTPDFLEKVGRGLGEMLGGLHRERIYYNDVTLSDQEGRSHLLVTDEGELTLIDFGVSVLLDRHPYLTLEEVYNVARTDPNFRLFARLGASEEEMVGFLRQYGQRLGRGSPEDIMARDRTIFEQGVRMAAGRMGEGVAGPLERGFRERYGR